MNITFNVNGKNQTVDVAPDTPLLWVLRDTLGMTGTKFGCGKALCGTVAWLKDAVDSKTGQPPVDVKNPDPSKRSRKILGIRIFAMEQDATGSWTGDIYNSDDGQNYKGRLAPRGENELEVQGCAGALCGSEVWTRAK